MSAVPPPPKEKSSSERSGDFDCDQRGFTSGFTGRMPRRRSFCSSRARISFTNATSFSGSCSTAAFAQSSIQRSVFSLMNELGRWHHYPSQESLVSTA